MTVQPFPTVLMSPNLLWGLLKIADAQGLETGDWLAGTGLDRTQLEDPAIQVTTRQTATVIERALRDLPPSAGLDLGAGQEVGNFALLGLAMTTAATFGEAIAIGIRYTPVHGGLMRFGEGASTADQISLVGEMTIDAPAIQRFVAEEFFSSCLALARGLVGETLRPERVEFCHPAPEYVARYAETFGCPVTFDQPQNRLLLDARWLSVPLRTHNPIAAAQVLGLLRNQMPAHVRGEVSATVERLIRVNLRGEPRLSTIAAQLHVSERTLRRQLAVEGSSFRGILERVRLDQAYALLRDRRMSIYQVGVETGYADPREFRRAFRRLTGQTPRQVRERLLSLAPETP